MTNKKSLNKKLNLMKQKYPMKRLKNDNKNISEQLWKIQIITTNKNLKRFH